MKLFFFAPNVILFRKRRYHWELIKWDRGTDEFTRGQWLTHKSIWLNGCSASADGTQFKYHYEDQSGAYVVTSKIPNFTAVEFHEAKCGRWTIECFDGQTYKDCGARDPPEGYRFVEGAVYKGEELLIDFSSDVFRSVAPM
jgi:hypothetical protein